MRKHIVGWGALLAVIVLSACAKNGTTVESPSETKHEHNYVLTSEKKETCTKDGENVL